MSKITESFDGTPLRDRDIENQVKRFLNQKTPNPKSEFINIDATSPSLQYSNDFSASKPIAFRDSKWAMGRDDSEIRSQSMEREYSPNVVYVIHHELKLMRFVWQNLQANALINQTDKMNNRIAY